MKMYQSRPEQDSIKGMESRETYVLRQRSTDDVRRGDVVTSRLKRRNAGKEAMPPTQGAIYQPPFRIRGPLRGEQDCLGRNYWCIIMTISCIFCVCVFVSFIVLIVKYIG